MDELDRSLGQAASYLPAPSGGISPERMELFLDLRTSLVSACDEYGSVRKGSDSVASLETRDPKDLSGVGEVASGMGGAALSITPFLARFFEQRNDALLDASMGLQEYAYIYAAAYHDLLLSDRTRNEIFSDGVALSPEASEMLRGCLERQLVAMSQTDIANPRRSALEAELKRMAADTSRLTWQDGQPEDVRASVRPYRERLDRVFCTATAGLEMERSASRAIRIALD
jgi:hypothetical protein